MMLIAMREPPRLREHQTRLLIPRGRKARKLEWEALPLLQRSLQQTRDKHMSC